MFRGMPNPPHASRRDLPLDEYVGYATHVVISCAPASIAPPCGRSVIWRTADLYARLPRCRTYREFTERLVCSRCKRPGWVEIDAAAR